MAKKAKPCVAKPKAKVAKPKAKVAKPKAKVAKPKAKAAKPKAKVDKPKGKAANPKTEVAKGTKRARSTSCASKSGGKKIKIDLDKKKNRPPGYKPRIPNPFILYYMDVWKMRKDQDKMSITKCAKKCGCCWNRMTEEQKNVYRRRYAALKAGKEPNEDDESCCCILM